MAFLERFPKTASHFSKKRFNGSYLGLDLDHIAAPPWWVSASFIFGLIFAVIHTILARAK